MYPQNYLTLFPPFPRTNRAFVAMSFAKEFDARWSDVLRPALAGLAVGGQPLDPFRVDLSKASDAILTEILQAISDCRVMVADITALNELDGRPIRNANVLYEVGIAHAVRRPEEVVLFRSDSKYLDFDIHGVRVHSYNPDRDVDGAIKIVQETVKASLDAFEATKLVAIRHASQRLTLPAQNVLMSAVVQGFFKHPQPQTLNQMVGSMGVSASIQLLLELGAIQSRYLTVSAESLEGVDLDGEARLLDYVPSEFGKSLVQYIAENCFPTDPEQIEKIKKALETLQSA